MGMEKHDMLPRELMTIPLYRYRRITTIHVTLKPEAAEIPGILEKVIQPISRRRVTIMGIYTSTMPAEYAYITIFIDSTRMGSEDLNSLIDEIEMGVREFDAKVKMYTSPIEGVAIDPYSFPITAMGSRAIILMQHSLEGIIKGLSRIGAEIILNMVGREIGKTGFEAHERIPSGAIAVPCRYIHSPAAITHISDIEATTNLIVKVILKLSGIEK
jgi:hypothetical protein